MDGVDVVMVGAHGFDATIHLALEDAGGDYAIIEFDHGGVVVHHGWQFTLVTNDPTYDEQLKLLVEQDYSHPDRDMPLPGIVNAVDRSSAPPTTPRRLLLRAVARAQHRARGGRGRDSDHAQRKSDLLLRAN